MNKIVWLKANNWRQRLSKGRGASHRKPMLMPTMTTTSDWAACERAMTITLGLSVLTRLSHEHSHAINCDAPIRPDALCGITCDFDALCAHCSPGLFHGSALSLYAQFPAHFASPKKVGPAAGVLFSGLQTFCPSAKPYASQSRLLEVSYNVHRSHRSLERLHSSKTDEFRTLMMTLVSMHTVLMNAMRNSRRFWPLHGTLKHPSVKTR
jgi:hypothetical protein